MFWILMTVGLLLVVMRSTGTITGPWRYALLPWGIAAFLKAMGVLLHSLFFWL